MTHPHRPLPSSLPSLLMEAAHTAAVEDGVTSDSQAVQQGQPQQQQQEPQPQQSAETTNSRPNSNSGSTNTEPCNPNADAVKQAALAMVASGNGTNMTSSVITQSPTAPTNGMTMSALQQQQQQPQCTAMNNLSSVSMSICGSEQHLLSQECHCGHHTCMSRKEFVFYHTGSVNTLLLLSKETCSIVCTARRWL